MELNYNWKLSDGYPPLTKGKVFSCFACGGGSTMGYKLAGFDVIGCNEIDPRMMAAYVANHHPKYSFLEDIRTFKNRTDLPEELYHLDILDGSPPCSSFSMAGSREDGWGVEKKFREGQSEQVLDTLFFDFIDLAKKLQPKVVIAENVKGLLLGEAREYYKKISFCFEDAGYEIQDFLLNAADMGVPQTRERVFFIGLRKDLCSNFMEQINLFHKKPLLKLDFKEKWILWGDIYDEKASCYLPPSTLKIWNKRKHGDADMGATNKREFGSDSYFTYKYLYKDKTPLTQTGHIESGVVFDSPRYCTPEESFKLASFPVDYKINNGVKACYLTGMSVPPLMIARIANEIYKQWLSKL